MRSEVGEVAGGLRERGCKLGPVRAVTWGARWKQNCGLAWVWRAAELLRAGPDSVLGTRAPQHGVA
jgi:hypothetical protein